MKKLITSLAVVLVALMLLAAPGLSVGQSESCAVNFTIPAVFEITVIPEFAIELTKTGFGGSYEIDPNVSIINDGAVMLSMVVDVLDLEGNELHYFLTDNGIGNTIVHSDGASVQIEAGTISGLLRVDITETTSLPGGLDVVSTVTISMTDV